MIAKFETRMLTRVYVGKHTPERDGTDFHDYIERRTVGSDQDTIVELFTRKIPTRVNRSGVFEYRSKQSFSDHLVRHGHKSRRPVLPVMLDLVTLLARKHRNHLFCGKISPRAWPI
jgi:hypothetical protein